MRRTSAHCSTPIPDHTPFPRPITLIRRGSGPDRTTTGPHQVAHLRPAQGGSAFRRRPQSGWWRSAQRRLSRPEPSGSSDRALADRDDLIGRDTGGEGDVGELASLVEGLAGTCPWRSLKTGSRHFSSRSAVTGRFHGLMALVGVICGPVRPSAALPRGMGRGVFRRLPSDRADLGATSAELAAVDPGVHVATVGVGEPERVAEAVVEAVQSEIWDIGSSTIGTRRLIRQACCRCRRRLGAVELRQGDGGCLRGSRPGPPRGT
jgi:hypothetical protein